MPALKGFFFSVLTWRHTEIFWVHIHPYSSVKWFLQFEYIPIKVNSSLIAVQLKAGKMGKGKVCEGGGGGGCVCEGANFEVRKAFAENSLHLIEPQSFTLIRSYSSANRSKFPPKSKSVMVARLLTGFWPKARALVVTNKMRFYIRQILHTQTQPIQFWPKRTSQPQTVESCWQH